MQNVKPLIKSWTAWFFGVLLLLAWNVDQPQIHDFIVQICGPDWAPKVLSVVAVIGFLLRLKTNKPVIDFAQHSEQGL